MKVMWSSSPGFGLWRWPCGLGADECMEFLKLSMVFGFCLDIMLIDLGAITGPRATVRAMTFTREVMCLNIASYDMIFR